MFKPRLLLFFIFISISCMTMAFFAEEDQENQTGSIRVDSLEAALQKMYPLPEPAYWISPTCDAGSPTEVYIPYDLRDAFAELDRMLTREFREYFANSPIEDTVKYHFGLGMWMRNNWGLWQGERLAQYFAELGIFHPDDMSAIILDSYWRFLNGTDICLEEQLEFYKEYWRRQEDDSLYYP